MKVFKVVCTKTNQIFSGMYDEETDMFEDVLEMYVVCSEIIFPTQEPKGIIINKPQYKMFGSPAVKVPLSVEYSRLGVIVDLTEFAELHKESYDAWVEIFKNPQKEAIVKPKSNLITKF